MSAETAIEPFAERPTLFAGVREHAGWRIKCYDTALPGTPLDEKRFATGVDTALAALPSPATDVGRPGLAILIRHQGASSDYVVMSWWGNSNELPTKVWLRDGGEFRPAVGDESFCVWDLAVLWFERQAFVDTMLKAPEIANPDAYLGRTYSA